MKKVLIFQLILLTCITFVLFGCTKKKTSDVKSIIEQAQKMTLQELALKAIEEANGKEFICVGSSSRGKTAVQLFIEYLQSIDSSFNMTYDWRQPKNNKIFDALTTDHIRKESEISMTLIQDGNQIKSKMVNTGILETFIPKEWAEANNTTPEAYKGFLPLQTINKVFMYNCVDTMVSFTNCWDYVLDGKHGQFMDFNYEVVGKNFLCMLTHPTYAAELKEAFFKLSASKQIELQPTINQMEPVARQLGLDSNGKYALAWIKRWVGSFISTTNDGPILANLVENDSLGQFGLLVYSKLRSVTETETSSKNNVKVAAYNDGYQGMGGYGYCHYLFVSDCSPLPWTSCAFIAYLTTTAEGFSSWGDDMGSYSSNPIVQAEVDALYHDISHEGDRGLEWWINEGKLVLEDPEYCAQVESTVAAWIDKLDRLA